MELLNKKKIVELLQSKNIDVQVVDTVDSTNDYVKQYKIIRSILINYLINTNFIEEYYEKNKRK